MRLTATIILATALALLSGCSRADTGESAGIAGTPDSSMDRSEGAANTTATASAPAKQSLDTFVGGSAELMQDVSLQEASASQNAAVPTERKIIRNATLSIETDAPAEGQRRIASVAESRGGYVVTSESRQQGQAGGDVKPYEVVTVEVRVPAAQFDAVMQEIRKVGTRITEEKITGQDVTEEFIDLEARIRTKKALEGQFMEIMKRASKVSDALEVQSQLAEVRTEIESLEGRRRFLENQSSLSTIKATLQPPSPFVAATTSGFTHSLKDAFGDGVDVGAAIVLALIRVLIALIPVVLFIFLPIALLVRFLLRRRRRFRMAEQLKKEEAAHDLK